MHGQDDQRFVIAGPEQIDVERRTVDKIERPGRRFSRAFGRGIEHPQLGKNMAHNLERVTLVLGVIGAQGFVPKREICEALPNAGNVEAAANAKSQRHVEPRAGRVHLVQEPDSPLGGRKRHGSGKISGSCWP